MPKFRVKVTAEMEVEVEQDNKDEAIDYVQQALETGEIDEGSMSYEFTAKRI
jgi:quinol monooxygenase YgiN